jgi:predicted transposase/invertase (TIGR01784 family)
MMTDFLLGFVKEDWIEQLDFNTLEKTNKSYVLKDLKSRHDDLIWKVKWKDSNQWMYIYLILEFQTEQEHFMAARMLNYVSSLYVDLIDSGHIKKPNRLPPVLPIVIYRGNNPWKCKLQIADLIETPPGQLKQYSPKLKYLLLDESETDDTELENMDNTMAWLIKLEKSETPDEAIKILISVTNWLKSSGDGYDNLRDSLLKFFVKAQKGIKLLTDKELQQLEYKNFEEIVHMWPERMEKLTEDLIARGKIEGESIGIKKGKIEGKIEVVLNMNSANCDIPMISQFTGLSVNQVKEILESNNSVN